MARLKGSSAANLLEIDGQQAARMSLLPPWADPADGGRFHASLKTGLITTIAAMTITAGHLFGFRNPSATKTILIDKLKIRVAIVTDFTTLQQMQVAARKATGFSVLHSAGGAAVTLTGEGPKLRTSMQQSIATAYLANAAAITGQTAVDISAKPPLVMASSGLPAAATTTVKVPFEDELKDGPIHLAQDEGIIVTNETLMSAAGTAIVQIDIGWREMLNANCPPG